MTNYIFMGDTVEERAALQCPFGVRDLSLVDINEPYGKRHNRCYDGNGKNRCPYFVRYDWEKYANHIVCTCDKPKVIAVKEDWPEFNFG